MWKYTASVSSGLLEYTADEWLCIWVCMSYNISSSESLAVIALGGLCRGCMKQQHRKRVKVPRVNWNQMSEATDRGILIVEQERQRGKFTSPDCLSVCIYIVFVFG